MINYIVQVLLFQTIFLAVYDLVLKKETFFQWNRFYLITTSILAYILPFLKFQSVGENLPQEYIEMLPEVMLSPTTYIEKQIDWSVILFTSLQLIFFIGLVLSALLFIYKLLQIIKLIVKNDSEKGKEYSLVLLSKEYTSFSFFRYIFLGKNQKEKEDIIKHELIHVKQKHSIDLIFFEIQKIVFWFNPFSYLYQNRITEIHEFIADSLTVNKKEKSTFYNSLLAQTFAVDKIAFVNAFNKQSLIKKRIIMFSKKNSKEILKFKYLLLIPVLMGMLVYTSCENTETEKTLSKVNEKRLIKTIMGGYTNKDGTVVNEKVIQTEKEGYLDAYLFGAKPEGKLISFDDLTNAERNEFNAYNEKMKEIWDGYAKYNFYEKENGERAFQEIIDKEKFKKRMNKKDYSNASVVPFAAIDQVPVFPGCEDAEDHKACFVQKITKHIGINFDTSITKGLDLEPGKKRVYVQFKIDKTGNIVDARARAPHKDLEAEATRVVRGLPQMQPGKQNGRTVAVIYTLPITFVVE
ncbi:MAG: M56 family metallopeptidase [Flavobacteriaceae bacterium]|nr:M56 family metallopeptidase [Flavobacteriaceae bacterium]